jgi:hypothetical protein
VSPIPTHEEIARLRAIVESAAEEAELAEMTLQRAKDPLVRQALTIAAHQADARYEDLLRRLQVAKEARIRALGAAL